MSDASNEQLDPFRAMVLGDLPTVTSVESRQGLGHQLPDPFPPLSPPPEVSAAFQQGEVISEISHGAAPAASPVDLGPEAADATLLGEIALRLDACERHLDELSRLGRERERVVDRLHEEKESLKNRDRERAMLPLLRDLIRLYDDMEKTRQQYDGNDEVSKRAAHDFLLYREAAADILARQGIETFLVEPGELFNASRHRALSSAPTENPALERRIISVVRTGFATDQQVIRAAEVKVYRHNPPSDTP